MHSYTVSQWLLFFYFYGFCGWVWASGWASIPQKRGVNRGILHGPLLPLYGVGALLILMTTWPVRGCWWGIALIGALSATVLAYGTHVVMEWMVTVRYWNAVKDGKRNGRIRVSSMVVWAVVSVLLVQTIQPWMGELVSRLPAFLTHSLVVGLSAIALVDGVRSIRAVRTLQATLLQITVENQYLTNLIERIEAVGAFSEAELQTFRYQTNLERVAFDEEGAKQWKQYTEKQSRKLRNRRNRWEVNLEQKLEAKRQVVETVMEEMEQVRPQLEEWFAKNCEGQSLSDAVETLHQIYARLRLTSPKNYRTAYRLLRRNPTAYAEPYQTALRQLTQLGEENQ